MNDDTMNELILEVQKIRETATQIGHKCLQAKLPMDMGGVQILLGLFTVIEDSCDAVVAHLKQ